MARLTNHFENDGDMGGFTTIKHHDHPHNETGDENESPQPPAHLIDPATKSAPVPIASATSDLSEVILASPAAGLAPPPSITSEVAGEDDAFGQIGSPRLSSGHSAKLSETLSSPRWSYENLRNQRWSYNSDVMERGVHDLKMLGEREGDGAQQAKHSVDGSATKDELNLTVSVGGNIVELKLICPGLADGTRRKPQCNLLKVALSICRKLYCVLCTAAH